MRRFVFSRKHPMLKNTTFKLPMTKADALWLESLCDDDLHHLIFELGFEAFPPTVRIVHEIFEDRPGGFLYVARLGYGEPFFEGDTKEAALAAAGEVLAHIGGGFTLEEVKVSFETEDHRAEVD